MSTVQKGIAYFQKYGLKAALQRIFVNDYDVFSKLPPEKYEEALKKWYKRKTGEVLDLDNPRTYNEKIQWLKLYDSTPLKTRLADKYLVRDWIKEKIGEEYLIPLLGVWDDFDEIDFDKLPNQFVLKANHGSGWNIIVKDKSKFNKNDARKKFKKWMKTNYAFAAGLELHYLNIPPKIIAEAYIEEAGHAYDYRFMCFNGEVELIWVDTALPPERRRALYSTNWKRLEGFIGHYPSAPDLKPPANLREMTELAGKLCQEFSHVRIDFYNVAGKIYVGEMTFTPVSGIANITPPEFNHKLGDLILLPEKSLTPQPTANLDCKL